MAKVVFIHGNGGGSNKDNWFPYLKQELTKLGLKVLDQDFPDADLARQNYWLPFLKNTLKADEDTIIIGHSSGAVAAMRFAEQTKLLGTVLVGACYTDLGDEKEKASGYYQNPWNWQSIKDNQKWIIQFASIDDPWIPIEEARFIHSQLDSEYYEYTNQGHFGGDREKKTFPEIVKIIKTKLKL